MDAPKDDVSLIPQNDSGVAQELSAWKSDWYFRRENPIYWWLSLAVPLLLTSGLLVYLMFNNGLASVGQFFGTCFVIIFVLGKSIIAGGHLDQASEEIAFYSPSELLAMVVYVDLCTTLLVVYHLGVILRLPLLGWIFDRLVSATTRLLLKYPRLRKLTYIGIALLVSMPFASGPSGGILGRILGLERRAIFMSAMIGTILGSLMILFFSDLLISLLGPRNAVAILLVGVTTALIVFGIRWLMSKRNATNVLGE